MFGSASYGLGVDGAVGVRIGVLAGVTGGGACGEVLWLRDVVVTGFVLLLAAGAVEELVGVVAVVDFGGLGGVERAWV